MKPTFEDLHIDSAERSKRTTAAQGSAMRLYTARNGFNYATVAYLQVQDVLARDGTRSWVTGSASLAGSGRVSVSDPVFDPVLSFNMRVYHSVVSTE